MIQQSEMCTVFRDKRKVLYQLLWFALAICSIISCERSADTDLDLPNLRLQISTSSFEKIKQKRGQALARGFLDSSGSDYQEAQIEYEGNTFAAQVRLKGDWLDHLKGKKWSWRVKLSDDASILNADQFSLQNPKTRFFLHEWVFHRLLEQEDILTPRYEFVELWVNDEYKGIYAFEAHFTEALLARQNRPAGVILKFNEDGFWQTQDYRLRYGKNVAPHLPDFEAADIEPFQKTKVQNDSILSAAFNAGRARLEQLRNPQDRNRILQPIDIDYWAKFFALVDVTEAYHALRWHNMRWYYHPQTAQLYPIGFDGYGSNGIYYWFKKTFLGEAKENGNKVFFTEEYFLLALFNNKDFLFRYRHNLLQYSSSDFIGNFLQDITPDISPLADALREEFPYYELQLDSLINRARNLNKVVQSYSFNTSIPFAYTIYQPLFDGCETSVPLSAVGLKAFRSTQAGELDLYNYYCQEITVEASGPKRNKPFHEQQESIQLPPFDINSIPPVSTTINIPVGDQYLFYSIDGVDYWFREKINAWPVDPPAFIDKDELVIDSLAFELDGTTIRPRSRHITFTSVQIIPKKYRLDIPAGTRMSLNSGASLIVYGSTNWAGTKSSIISIGSDDNTGRGVHFIDVDTLELAYVTMANNQPFRDRGLLLNGAMTCWADSMRLEHLTFRNIESEDALNVINSPRIDLRQLQFSDCSGDGLDIDFSAGSLQGASFKELGGDGLDLSGSVVTVAHLDFADITDKALSVGEKTMIEVENLSINEANIGIAIKDESKATIRHSQVENCEFGITVFNKKNYFGPAQLYVDNCQFNLNVQVPIAVESSHELVLDGQLQKATHLSGELARLFYPPAH